MRLTRVLFILAGLSALAVTVAAQSTVPLRHAPLEAFGVICEQQAGEVELTTGSVHTRELTYTGVVISGDERVAGMLTYSVTLSRDLEHGTLTYSGHIEVQPTALEGRGEWHGAFGGEVARDSKWENASALGRDLLHRRTVLARRSVSSPVRSARPPELRVVRRLLRGTGELDGMRLVFDHKLDEGVRPAARDLPVGCMSDYELWKGVIVNLKK
jgi:hypothetical protein